MESAFRLTRARDLASLASDGSLFAGSARDKLESLLSELEPLVAHYDVVVANPPYMGGSNMNKWLSEWTKKHYVDSRRDLCTCFIERSFEMADQNGFSALVTMDTWMRLGNTEKLRRNILKDRSIVTLVFMNHMVMRIAFDTSATVFRNRPDNSKGLYTCVNYSDLDKSGTPRVFPAGRVFKKSAKDFMDIPNSPIAFWVCEAFPKAFSNKTLEDYGSAKSGVQTGDNDLYLRYWQEVGYENISFNNRDKTGYLESGCKWTPQVKGGEYRKWYGNFDYVINWQNDGKEIRDCPSSRLNAMGNDALFFREGVTWSHTTSGVFGARFLPYGHLFNVEAPVYFAKTQPLSYCLGFLNSSVAQYFLDAMSPSLHYLVGNISPLPLAVDCDMVSAIDSAVTESIRESKRDWDESEISWDFKRHPIV